ncbi:hypothetical protein ES707_05679 [subsurface metagenome]
MEKDPSKIPTAKKVILIITTRIIQSMQAIRVLNLKGYYYDLRVLERCLLENMGLCAYFALNEEETEKWIKGKNKIARIRLIDYISLLVGIKEGGWIPIYGKLSGYVHTNLRSIASLIVDIDPEGISFQVTPIFDKEKVSEISLYPTVMLIILARIFRDELTKTRKARIMRFCKQILAEKS